MNVMVMAGTKDAANIIKKLSEVKEVNILATTTTDYGGNIVKSAGADEIISKGLNNDELVEIIKEKNINVLVDSTHPFASQATLNAIDASKSVGIKYIRFERPSIDIVEDPLIHKVFSFHEASAKALELTNGRVLHLAGVSTLKPVIGKIDPSLVFARVLPSVDSIQQCLDLGLKPENIIAMQGTFSKKFNKALMKEYDISLIITKESGEIGGTLSKISGALELGIHIVLVTRPKISELSNKNVFTDLDEIISFILKSDD
ncbi:MAG: precorrin-6A reductase [Methanobacterium sp.]|uniref:precorrin-6A reductase n=1 Tax=Methanobacterium sp. TaxID=2164 RepID=UPI003D64B2E8|nr:precorrin-6A reductase [Methanobacterium sp.]